MVGDRRYIQIWALGVLNRPKRKAQKLVYNENLPAERSKVNRSCYNRNHPPRNVNGVRCNTYIQLHAHSGS